VSWPRTLNITNAALRAQCAETAHPDFGGGGALVQLNRAFLGSICQLIHPPPIQPSGPHTVSTAALGELVVYLVLV
jgi:hypothetical protein